MNLEDQSEVPHILGKFIDGLTKSAGAASAFVHDHQDPRWIQVRDKLNAIKDKAIGIAIKASGITVRNVQN